MNIRFMLALLCLGFFGCAPAKPAMPPEQATVSRAGQTAQATPATARRGAVLDEKALGEYDRERVEIVLTGRKPDFVLEQNGVMLSEADFRKTYRTVVGSGDLDADAWRRAKKANVKVVAIASGLTVVGVGGLAWMAATRQPTTCPNCAKAVLSLAMFSGVGLYALGCELVKGARCVYEGKVTVGGAGLRRDEARRFVDEYNAALLRSILKKESS
jgi:hypothetical protein